MTPITNRQIRDAFVNLTDKQLDQPATIVNAYGDSFMIDGIFEVSPRSEVKALPNGRVVFRFDNETLVEG